MPESVTPARGALASLHPRLHVPAHLRRPVLLAVPALVGAWSLPGFYGSLGPALVRRLVHSDSPAVSGLALFVLAGGGGLAVLVARRCAPRTLTLHGTLAIAAGMAIVAHASSGTAFFLGSLLAGAGFGASFQGTLRSVMNLTAPHERAGVLSVIYIVCYLATGVLAVLAGLLVVHGGGILVTAHRFGVAVILLAVLVLVARGKSHQR